MKVTDLPKISSFNGDEVIMLVRNGVSYRATLEDIRKGEPDAKGLYPDVPINYVEIVRYSGQESTTVVMNGNTELATRIFANVFPCTIDRNGLITQMLNGNDVTKTVDGLPAVLNDWSQPCMVRYGGYWTKYFYDASTNTKHLRYSPYKVRGYKYVRRRFLAMYSGGIESHESKDMLTSNAGVWTRESENIMTDHADAKNMGDTFRIRCVQDRKVYRDMFWLMEKTFNSQSVQQGCNGVSWDWWGKFSQAENGGQSEYAQFYKNGITNSVKGHKGEVSITVNNGESDATVKAQKWGWIEAWLGGPYWLWEGGALKKGDKWYVAKDINSFTSWDPTSDQYTYLCDAVTTGGYILENFEDTIIASQVGGTDHTGHCDHYWRAEDATGSNVYIPAGSGGAHSGSALGVSVLHSHYVVSDASPHYGSALASDDPTDTTPDGTVAA